jgi:hypothetical protein
MAAISTTSTPRRKPGPVPKGNRSPVYARVPVEHRAVYEREAEALGLALGDYAALVLARYHDLPEPDYIERSRKRPAAPELPLASGQ